MYILGVQVKVRLAAQLAKKGLFGGAIGAKINRNFGRYYQPALSAAASEPASIGNRLYGRHFSQLSIWNVRKSVVSTNAMSLEIIYDSNQMSMISV